MSDLRSYAKILHVGHAGLHPIAAAPVVVEEKVDGSQFSFGVVAGALHMRSKRVAIHGVEGCPNLFLPTVEHVTECFRAGLLVEGWTYRGEAFCKERHNTLTYGRVPAGHFVLFDVDKGLEDFADTVAREQIAADLGVDCIAVLDRCLMSDLNETRLTKLLATESALGGALVEGVVMKPVAPICGPDGKRLAAKFVSEAFKETHKKTFKSDRPEKQDIVAAIADSVSNPARWMKAIQRLRDEDRLTQTPADIGPLIAEVKRDVVDECEDDIKDMLFAAYRKEVVRLSTRGLPEWYKRELAFGGAR